jgi:hypothetical protein
MSLGDLLNDDVDIHSSDNLKRPKTHLRKEVTRIFVNGLKKEAMTKLIPTLPPPNTDMYIIGNGSGAEIKHGNVSDAFDFGTFIPYLVELLGNVDVIAYVSTWAMNRNHALNLIEMLDNGNIKTLKVVTDPYFTRRESAVANTLIEGIQRHNQTFLTFKNHVKAICLLAPDGRTVTVTGSANLSSQPRCEQYNLTTAPDVYNFFVADFFEEMIKRNG